MADPVPAAVPLGGVHHAAFRCRDAEQTRWFYEDVLGLEAVAGLVAETVPGTNAEMPFMHLFFALGDGNYIAFFDSPTDADPAWFRRKSSFDMHIAFQAASEADMLAMQARLQAHGVQALGPLDHDFVRSIYMFDPNGIQVEITVRTPGHDAFLSQEQAELPAMLRAWSERTRALKLAKFGEDALAFHEAPAE